MSRFYRQLTFGRAESMTWATMCFCGLQISSLAVAALQQPAQREALQSAQLAGEMRGVAPLDQVLVDARRFDQSLAELTGKLANSGSCEELFDLMSAGVFQIRVGERGRSAEQLRLDERRAALTALTHLSRADLHLVLDERLASHPSESERAAALEILSEHGEASDLETLFAWAETEAPTKRVPRRVRLTFESSLARFLDRKPRRTVDVSDLYARLNLSLLQPCVAALGATATPARLDALSDLLGRVPEFDSYVLAEMQAVAKVARFVPSGRASESARRYLSSSDRTKKIEAISIASAFVDPLAITALIRELETSDAALRRVVLRALSRITSEQLDPATETWTAWHGRENAWWMGEAPKAIRQARSAAPGVASRAIQELSLIRHRRHDLVEPLVLVFQREEIELVVLATAALGHLGSMDAIPHLVAQLEAERVEARRAAYRALRRMTGENHGDDPDAWRFNGWGPPLREDQFPGDPEADSGSTDPAGQPSIGERRR